MITYPENIRKEKDKSVVVLPVPVVFHHRFHGGGGWMRVMPVAGVVYDCLAEQLLSLYNNKYLCTKAMTLTSSTHASHRSIYSNVAVVLVF